MAWLCTVEPPPTLLPSVARTTSPRHQPQGAVAGRTTTPLITSASRWSEGVALRSTRPALRPRTMWSRRRRAAARTSRTSHSTCRLRQDRARGTTNTITVKVDNITISIISSNKPCWWVHQMDLTVLWHWSMVEAALWDSSKLLHQVLEVILEQNGQEPLPEMKRHLSVILKETISRIM